MLVWKQLANIGQRKLFQVVYKCEFYKKYLQLSNKTHLAILATNFPRVKASVIWRLFENNKYFL